MGVLGGVGHLAGEDPSLEGQDTCVHKVEAFNMRKLRLRLHGIVWSAQRRVLYEPSSAGSLHTKHRCRLALPGRHVADSPAAGRGFQGLPQTLEQRQSATKESSGVLRAERERERETEPTRRSEHRGLVGGGACMHVGENANPSSFSPTAPTRGTPNTGAGEDARGLAPCPQERKKERQSQHGAGPFRWYKKGKKKQNKKKQKKKEKKRRVWPQHRFNIQRRV